MRMHWMMLTALALVGCDRTEKDAVDEDGDGFTDTEDCDDTNAAVNPGAAEVCDGLDNNCNGDIDDDPTDGTGYYVDNDGDGYGASGGEAVTLCGSPGDSYADNADDCDDTYKHAYPGATERCDGADNDCDGTIDNGAGDLQLFYADTDGDGYGDPDSMLEACAAPDGYTRDFSDCDDSNADINPDTEWYADGDGDGYADAENSDVYVGCEEPFRYTFQVGDCDDTRNTVYPGATEICNALDDDCDGSIPKDELDGDGDGAPTCDELDCDDTDPTIYVGAEEDCDDEVDNDCDGLTNEACATDIADGADVTLSGGTTYRYFGTAVAAGDVSGDGVDDFIVGAYYENGSTSYSGTAYVFYGPMTSGFTASNSSADVTLSGKASYDYFGWGTRTADLDGDGTDDLIVNAYGDDTGASTGGAAFVFYGPVTSDMSSSSADAAIVGVNTSDYVGYYPSEVGDFDDDGDQDVVVGAHYYDLGSLYSVGILAMFDEPSGEYDIDEADTTLYGATSNSYTGYSMDMGTDLNGDGTSDIMWSDPGRKTVYTVYGPATADTYIYSDSSVTYYGSTTYAGASVESGDVNGDGYTDVVIGIPYDTNGGSSAGAYSIFFGPVSSDKNMEEDFDAYIIGSGTYNYMGNPYYGQIEIEDLNGDDTDDLLIGGMYNELGGSSSNSGALMMFYGPVTGVKGVNRFDHGYYGSSSSHYLGRDLATGDLDDDGEMDIVTGSYYAAGSYTGQAYAIFGASL